MVRERAIEECLTLGEAFDEGYEQGRADAIDECIVAFNELAIKWFNQGCIALGDIPRVVDELKEQKK